MYPTQQSEHVSYITRFVMVPKVRWVAYFSGKPATERASKTYHLGTCLIFEV
jgi:hypothetical protein